MKFSHFQIIVPYIRQKPLKYAISWCIICLYNVFINQDMPVSVGPASIIPSLTLRRTHLMRVTCSMAQITGYVMVLVVHTFMLQDLQRIPLY